LNGEEVREFDIFVKGKPAGRSTIRIRTASDGRITANTEAKVSLSFVVYTYRYEYHGSETWHNGRLLETQSQAVDDGKRLGVRATVDGQGSRIALVGQPVQQGPILWMTTSYWHLPRIEPSAALTILDADTGRQLVSRLERVATETFPLAGGRAPCTHYRLIGDANAELWFDASDRLVRQKTVEDGYPTELRLARLTSPAGLTQTTATR
jgi:hypothetical protein